MKRNFFKYMLLGAFTLALGVGFVGCKDYDDDIDAINSKIAALEQTSGSLAQLQAQINAKIDKTAADQAIATAKTEAIAEAQRLISEAIGNGGNGNLQDLLNRVEAIEDGLGDYLDAIEGIDLDDLASLGYLLTMQEDALTALKDNGFVDEEGEPSWAEAMTALKAAQETLGSLTPDQLENLGKLIEAVEAGLSLLDTHLSTLTLIPQVKTADGDDGIKFRTYYYQPQALVRATGTLGNYAGGYRGDDWDISVNPSTAANFAAWSAYYRFVTTRPIVHYTMNSRLVNPANLDTDGVKFLYNEVATRSEEIAQMTQDDIVAEYVSIENGDLLARITAPGLKIQHYAGFYQEYYGWKAGVTTGSREISYGPNLSQYNNPAGTSNDLVGHVGVEDGQNITWGDHSLDAVDQVQLQVPLAEGDNIVSSDWGTMYNFWMPDFQILHKGKKENTYYGEQLAQFAAQTPGTPASTIVDYFGRKPVSGDYAYATVRYWNDPSTSYIDANNAELNAGELRFDESWTYTLDYPAKYGFPAYTALNNTITKGQLYNNAEWHAGPDARSPQYHVWQPDTVLYVGQTIDLRGVVRAGVLRGETYYTPEFADIDIEEFGFRWEFESLDYMIGNTNQKDFVQLNGSVASSKVFGVGDEGAGVGRTPLFRAKIMDGDRVVKTAYIKVEIVRPPVQKSITIPIPTYLLDCNGVDSTTVEQMNVLVYNYMQISKEQFHTDYTFFVKTVAPTDVDADGRLDDGYFVAGDVGTVDQIVIQEVVGEDRGTTYLLEWSLSPKEMYDNMGKDIKNVVKYVSASGGSEVVITLTSHIDFPVVDIVQADTYAPFWSRTNPNSKPAQGVPAGTDFFMQNTAVPHSGTDALYTNNTFTNNIYAGFVTYPEGTWNGANGQLWGANKWGKINVDNEDPAYMPDDVYTKYKNFFDNLQVHYFFKVEENTRDFVADGKTYKIRVDDGTNTFNAFRPAGWTAAEAKNKVLYATQGNATQVIAQIAPVNTKASAELSAAIYANNGWDWDDNVAIMGNGVNEKLYYSLQYGDINNTSPDVNGPDNGEHNDFADIILNSDEFAAYIESVGWMCGDPTRPINITGDYADFWVKFIRPVRVNDNNSYWIDADNGYSWIRVSDVIKLVDWRDYSFDVWNDVRTVNSNANLYGFYGTAWNKLAPDFSTAKISTTGVGGQTINDVNLAYATATEILNGAPVVTGYHPALDADAEAVANIPGDTRAYYRIDGTTANYPAAYTNSGAPNDVYYFGYRNMGQPVSTDWYITFNAKLGYNWGELPILVKIKLHPSAWAPVQQP